MKKMLKSALMISLFTQAFLFAQYNFFDYYGKNKVIREHFKWKYDETDNFKIYYYVDNDILIKKLAAHAEEAYEQIATFLSITIEKKIPIIYYKSQPDFQQTNLYPGFLPPGVMAFAEPIGHRIVIHGDQPYESLARTLTHELAHIFEFAIIYRDISAQRLDIAPPPLWTMEGFAEFITASWDSFSLMTMRDAVFNEYIPELGENNDFHSPHATSRTPYDFGHLAYEFIYERFGRRGVRRLLSSLRAGPIIGRRQNIAEQFGFTLKEFNFEFRKFILQRFQDFADRENPQNYSIRIAPEMPFFYTFSHRVSKSGEMVALLTVDIRTFSITVVLVSMKDGTLIKKITPGFTSKYDSIEFKFDPADGSSLSWDMEEKRIAFIARREYDNFLVVVDILSGAITNMIKISAVQDPASPDFHPDGRRVYFTGLEGLHRRAWFADLEKGKITAASDGTMFIQSLNISPDGNQAVYSAALEGRRQLFLAPLQNLDQPKLVFKGEFDAIAPAFSRDGGKILFSADERGAFNIYSLDLQSQRMARYTDVRTGNFFPAEAPLEPGKLVVSSFHKGTFSLFKISTEEALEEQLVSLEPLVFSPPAKPEEIPPGLTLASAQPYRPLETLYISSLPSVAVGIGTDGNFLGYSYLNASDLMADYNFNFLLYSQYGYRSFNLSFFNQKKRFQYLAYVFSFTDGYYLSYQASSYFTVRRRFGGGIAAFYPFSRATRLELSCSLFNQEENSDLLFYGFKLPYGQFFSGMAMPVSVSLINETTLFAPYGPNRGQTYRFSLSKYIGLSSSYLDAYTLEGDYRKYLRLGPNTLFAFRLKGYYSGGKNPLIQWSGGNNTIRSAGFHSLVGDRGFVFNAEFRFPLVHVALTPIGLVGPLRGLFFFDLGAFWFKDQEFSFFKSGQGLTLQDPLASYGFGLQFFLFGIPFHVEWVTRTDLKQKNYRGVNFWIGFDF